MQVTHYFTIETLQQRINTEAIYKGRNRKDLIGLDDTSTIDAETLIREYLSTASYEVYSKLISSLSRTIEDDYDEEPFEFGVLFTDNNDVEYEDCIVYRYLEPDTMPTNLRATIRRAIEDCIVYYSVYNWLMDSNVPDWQKYELIYREKEDNLRSLTKRRVGLVRAYKLY